MITRSDKISQKNQAKNGLEKAKKNEITGGKLVKVSNNIPTWIVVCNKRNSKEAKDKFIILNNSYKDNIQL